MSQLYVDNIRNRTGGPIGIPTGAVVTGVITATTGNITGNLTVGGNADITGVLTYEDVTNVDSVGVVTARSGIEFGASGVGGTITATGQAEFAGVCTASSFSGSFDGSTASFSGNVSIADSIFHTGDTDTAIRFPDVDTFTVETAGSERVRVTGIGSLGVGLNDPKSHLHVSKGTNTDDGVVAFTIGGTAINTRSSSITKNNVGSGDRALEIRAATGNSTETIKFLSDSTTETLRITADSGFHFNNGELIERVKITAGKLSDNTNIDLENGMVHHFTTTETTTSTPNIRVSSSTSLNSVMAIGDTIAVTLITTAAAAGYSAQLTIDGVAVTEKWNGGSAPSAGGSSGNDIYSYQIIKTADATFTVLGNVSNFA